MVSQGHLSQNKILYFGEGLTVLCDDIIAGPWSLRPLLRDRLSVLSEQVANAQKFVLDRQFAGAADVLSSPENNDHKNLDAQDKAVATVFKLLPWARLPFTSTWIEFAFNDRVCYSDEPLIGLEGRPLRVGFMCEQIEEKKYEVSLYWSHNTAKLKNELLARNPTARFGQTVPNTSVEMSRQSITIDLTEHLVATSHPGDLVGHHVIPTYGIPFAYGFNPHLKKMAEKLAPDLFHVDSLEQEMLAQPDTNWQGEQHFIVTVLGLLNTRNFGVVDKIDNSVRNDKAAKRGSKSLASYHLCKLRLRRPDLARLDGNKSKEARSALRAHLVRGHFKERQSGMFWWSQYQRGDLALGFVRKDYSVGEGTLPRTRSGTEFKPHGIRLDPSKIQN